MTRTEVLIVVLIQAIICMVIALSGCCTWQGLADTGIMGAGWNTEVAK